jgi:hypothetical protein
MNKLLGYFDDEATAARADDEAARQHFGVFGRLNFRDVGKADNGGWVK